MTLNNDLFKIEKEDVIDGAHYSFTVSLNAGHLIYKAHFPRRPVTPGVIILQIALELIEKQTGLQPMVDNINNVKFLSVIEPAETPVVVFSFVHEKGKVKCNVSTTEGKDLTKMSLTIKLFDLAKLMD